MQLSTDLPYGPRAIRAHLVSGRKVLMNVSKEANAMFLRELERTDSKRYSRLEKAIRAAALQRLCSQCGLALPSDIRKDSRYCDRTCQKNAYLDRKAA